MGPPGTGSSNEQDPHETSLQTESSQLCDTRLRDREPRAEGGQRENQEPTAAPAHRSVLVLSGKDSSRTTTLP